MHVETLRALAEPSRLQIIDLLLLEPLTVGGVAERLGIRQPQASKHLRTLGNAGLVEMRPDAQRRVYALRVQPFQELDQWLDRFRERFEEQFQRLDLVLADLQASRKPRKKHASRAQSKRRR